MRPLHLETGLSIMSDISAMNTDLIVATVIPAVALFVPGSSRPPVFEYCRFTHLLANPHKGIRLLANGDTRELSSCPSSKELPNLSLFVFSSPRPSLSLLSLLGAADSRRGVLGHVLKYRSSDTA